MNTVSIKKVAACVALLAGTFAASQASASAITLANNDFETGTLNSWSTIGTVNASASTSVTTFDSTVWSIIAAGTTMAALQSNGANVSSIESTLGISAGTLDALNTNPSSAFQQNKYTLNDSDVELIPSKDSGKLVHFVNALEDARLEFIERGDADMAQERARHF